jgi:hypothetical protein
VPTARYYPVIFQFLGYDQFAAPSSLCERLAAKRRELGLTVVAAAKLAGVDEGTFRRWERGEMEAPHVASGSAGSLRHAGFTRPLEASLFT